MRYCTLSRNFVRQPKQRRAATLKRRPGVAQTKVVFC